MAKKGETVTIQEAAEMLGISVMTLRRRIDEGAIKPLPHPAALKRPRRILFRRDYIESMLD